MRVLRTFVFGFIAATSGIVVAPGFAAPSADSGSARPESPFVRKMRTALAQLPLAYEVNRGQAPSGWDFLVRCRGYHAFVASTGVTFSLDGAPLAVSLAGATKVAPVTRGLELEGRVNYFRGRDASKWIRAVPTTRGASYKDAAPGTSWTFGGRSGRLEFTFDLAPGLDEARLAVSGARTLAVDSDGTLRAAMPHGVARFSRPVAWQEVEGRRVDVPARFVVDGKCGVNIAVSPRDPRCGVRIDPTVTYESYFGGSESEQRGGAALDASGNAYFAGSTNSPDFPTTAGAYDTSRDTSFSSTSTDAFVTKFDAAGSTLVWSTFVGGKRNEQPNGLFVDESGDAWFTGVTFDDSYPTTSGTYSPTAPAASGPMGVLTEVASDGASLVFSTYIQAVGNGLAPGPSGSVWVIEGPGISKYAAGGTGLDFSRRIDPAVTNAGESMTISEVTSDSNGDAYVVGDTSKTNYALTAGAFQTTLAGGQDAFVTKIDATNTVVYASLLGGSGQDGARAVGVNWSGQAFVAGGTASTDFPTTEGAYRRTRIDPSDSFLTRFRADGSSLRSSTYLGTPGGVVLAIRVHPCGSCILGGSTADGLVTLDPFQSSVGSTLNVDGFLMKFEPDDTLAFSSYCGGADFDSVRRIGMGPDGSVAVQLFTDSTDLPTVSPYQAANGGSVNVADTAILKIPDTLPTTLTDPVVGSVTLPEWTVGVPYSHAVPVTDGLGPYSITLTSGAVPSGLTLVGDLLSGTPDVAGTSVFDVAVIDVCEKTGIGTVTLKINAALDITTTAFAPWTVGAVVDQSIATSGGTGAIAFSLASGSAPAGTSLGADGKLTGTPTTAGDFTLDVLATDSVGATANKSLAFHVNDVPSIGDAAPAACTETRPFHFQFVSTGGTAPIAWSLATGTLPTPESIDPATGLLDGTAGAAGDYAFQLTVTDLHGVAAQHDFDVTINPFPTIPQSILPPAAIGRPYQTTLSTAGGTPNFVWELAAGDLPTGMALDAAGTLQGDVTAAGATPPTLRATDSCGAAVEKQLPVVVAGALDLTKKSAFERIALGAGGVASASRWMELTAGTKLSASLTGASSKTDAAQLLLTDGAGTVVDLSAFLKTTKKSTSIKGFVVPTTGRWFLTLIPAPGVDAQGKLKVAIAPKNVWTSSATLDGVTPVDYAFAAPPGALLTITVKPEKKSAVQPTIVSITDASGHDVLADGTVAPKGKSLVFKSSVPLSGGDLHVVFGTQGGTTGAADWRVTLKLPRTYDFALPLLPAGR